MGKKKNKRAVENMKLLLEGGAVASGGVAAVTGSAVAGLGAPVFGVALLAGKYAENNLSPSEQYAFGEYLIEEAIQPYCP